MKKYALLSLLACLLIGINSSCVTQRQLIFGEGYAVKAENNSIEKNDSPLLRINRSTLNLNEKGLTLEKGQMSKKLEKHLSSILKECHSDQDLIIAASLDFIIVKNKNIDHKDARYFYQYDFEVDKWVCMGTNMLKNNDLINNDSWSFYRSLYVVKRRNRLIVKDNFGDISVIYVIQGENKNAPFYTTRVWDPSDFSFFITAANYIEREINPISYSIAKNK